MNIISNTNRKLVRQIKSSNVEVYKSVFTQYHDEIFNFLYYKMGNIQAAEDVLQDTFVTLWENRHNLKEDLSLKSYLYTLAKNKALNFIRHQNVVLKYQQTQKTASIDEQTASPQTVLEAKEFHEVFLKAAGKLPEMQRIVFMMSRFEQLSNKEIAKRLDISVKTVATHIGRATKKLHKILKPIL